MFFALYVHTIRVSNIFLQNLSTTVGPCDVYTYALCNKCCRTKSSIIYCMHFVGHVKLCYHFSTHILELAEFNRSTMVPFINSRVFISLSPITLVDSLTVLAILRWLIYVSNCPSIQETLNCKLFVTYDKRSWCDLWKQMYRNVLIKQNASSQPSKSAKNNIHMMTHLENCMSISTQTRAQHSHDGLLSCHAN